MISFNLPWIKSLIWFCGNILSVSFNSSILLERLRNLKVSTSFSVCFFKALAKGEYVNLSSSIIWLLLEGNISSPVRYSYLSILPDDNADIFVTSLLISYAVFHL